MKRTSIKYVLGFIVLIASNGLYGSDAFETYQKYIFLRTNRAILKIDGKVIEHEQLTNKESKAILSIAEAQAMVSKLMKDRSLPAINSAFEDTNTTNTIVNGYDLSIYSVRARRDSIGASCPSDELYTILDNGYIYELFNEGGFQENVAVKWYYSSSKVPKDIKRKVIAVAALSYSNVYGFIEEENDFMRIYDNLIKMREPNQEQDDEKMRNLKMLLKAKSIYYNHNSLPKDKDCTYYIADRAFIDYLSLKITRKGVIVKYECITPCPGIWQNDDSKGQYNGVRL